MTRRPEKAIYIALLLNEDKSILPRIDEMEQRQGAQTRYFLDKISNKAARI